MMERLGYRPALDGVRAVAIAAVVGVHVLRWPVHGREGVDVFFVLSGFLITTLLLEEHVSTGRVSFRGFYRRRLYRLAPALVVMLAAYAVVAAVSGRLDRDAVLGLAAGLGYVTNLVDVAGYIQHLPLETRPLWTLAQEEQFYLLWPPVLFLVFRGRTRLALAGVAVAVAASVAQGWRLADQPIRVLAGPDTRAVGILIGCAAALLLARRPRLAAEIGRRLSLPAFAVMVGMLLYMPGSTNDRFFRGPSLVFTVACAIVVLAAYDGRSLVPRTILASRPFVYAGRISYSLYLWNVLVLETLLRVGFLPTWLARGLALVLSVGIAAASYRFVEMPFLRRRRRLSAAKSPAPVVTVAPAS